MSANNRTNAIHAIAEALPPPVAAELPPDESAATYGADVFGEKAIRRHVPKKVAAKLGIAMWTFRLHVLPGFVSRFKTAWSEVGF